MGEKKKNFLKQSSVVDLGHRQPEVVQSHVHSCAEIKKKMVSSPIEAKGQFHKSS